MLTVIQRVEQAHVTVYDELVGAINEGLLILCGFSPHDTHNTLQKMLKKCLNYRIFSDDDGKMNLSLKDIGGGLLLVPQFTLLAETSRGLRPSFSKASSPEQGKQLFTELVELAATMHSTIAQGTFGAEMQVSLCNDGPVTFIMEF